ncbi:MAG: hypothetical protein QM658_16825 [Gordonia sp. (in: high G+C Gram-positive bacteria)]
MGVILAGETFDFASAMVSALGQVGGSLGVIVAAGLAIWVVLFGVGKGKQAAKKAS